MLVRCLVVFSQGFFWRYDRPYSTFIIVCGLTSIWLLAPWLPDNSTPALIAFAVLFGFFSGSYVSLLNPMVAVISPLNELGFRTGLVFGPAAISGPITNPINRAILDGNGGS